MGANPALEHFREFLKMGADPKVTDAQRAKARENVAELEKKVGQIDFEVPATAQVKVDGKVLAEIPRDPLPVAPGRHVVEATFEGKIKSVTVECVAGNRTKATIVFEGGGVTEPPPEGEKTFWSTGRTVGAIMAGAGLVSIGVGVGFHFVASSTEDDAAKTRGTLPDSGSGCFGPAGSSETCAGLRSAEDDYKTQGAFRNIFVGAGAALLVGGAALFFVSGPGRKEPTRGARLVPVASGREAGAVLLGQF